MATVSALTGLKAVETICVARKIPTPNDQRVYRNFIGLALELVIIRSTKVIRSTKAFMLTGMAVVKTSSFFTSPTILTLVFNFVHKSSLEAFATAP